MSERDCLEYLEDLGIEYDIVQHGAVYTVDEAMAEPALQGRTEIKNLFLQDDKGRRFYLVIMPGTKQLNLKQLAADLDEKKVRFCSAEKVERMLGVQPGSVSLFCCLNPLSKHIKVVVDEEILKQKESGFHPIVNTSTVFISPEGVKRVLDSLEQEYRVQKL